MSDTDMMSAKEVARELGTDARTFRKFMRATLPKEDQPGQGNRYQIDPEELDDIRKAFKAWGGGKPKQTADDDVEDEAPKPKKKKSKKKAKVEEIEELDDEDIVDLSDLDGPDEDELEELEDLDLEDIDIEDLDD